MSKRVTAEELRERLDDHVAQLEQGETLTLWKDGHEIADIQPRAHHALNIERKDSIQLGITTHGIGSSNARPTIDGSTDRSRYSQTASASG